MVASDLLTMLAGFGWLCIIAVVFGIVWLLFSAWSGRRGP